MNRSTPKIVYYCDAIGEMQTDDPNPPDNGHSISTTGHSQSDNIARTQREIFDFSVT
jgi:hypothetical protein